MLPQLPELIYRFRAVIMILPEQTHMIMGVLQLLWIQEKYIFEGEEDSVVEVVAADSDREVLIEVSGAGMVPQLEIEVLLIVLIVTNQGT